MHTNSFFAGVVEWKTRSLRRRLRRWKDAVNDVTRNRVLQLRVQVPPPALLFRPRRGEPALHKSRLEQIHRQVQKSSADSNLPLGTERRKSSGHTDAAGPE